MKFSPENVYTSFIADATELLYFIQYIIVIARKREEKYRINKNCFNPF